MIDWALCGSSTTPVTESEINVETRREEGGEGLLIEH